MTHTPRWTLGARSTVGLTFALVLLLAVGTGAVWQLRSFRRATSSVRHSLMSANAIEALTRTLVDAETGQRGYLLTGKEAYLEPLAEARDRLSGQVEGLDRLIGDDASQRRRFAELVPLVRARLDELTATVELHHTQGPAASLALVQTDAGKRAMDDLRAVLTTMADEEAALLDERLASADRRSARLLAFQVSAGALAFALVAGCLVALNAQDRRRLAVQRLLVESEERLRVTLRSIGDAVIATDDAGRVIFMNPVAEVLTDWTSDDARGRTLDEVFVIANETTRATVDSPGHARAARRRDRRARQPHGALCS